MNRNGLAGKIYRRTMPGMLYERWAAIRGKHRGTLNQGKYKGIPCMSKADFFNWADGNEVLLRLYSEWVASGFDLKLAPSVDRIDRAKGYVLGNVQWLTMSDNARKGGLESERYPGQLGHVGIFKRKGRSGFSACARYKRKNIYLGAFKTIEEAIKVRSDFIKKMNSDLGPIERSRDPYPAIAPKPRYGARAKYAQIPNHPATLYAQVEPDLPEGF